MYLLLQPPHLVLDGEAPLQLRDLGHLALDRALKLHRLPPETDRRRKIVISDYSTEIF